MADIWDAYIKEFGIAPNDASQLQHFTKTNTKCKRLSFTEASDVFNSHKTKPIVTNKKPLLKLGTKPMINKPLPSNERTNEIKRQKDECILEKNNLESIKTEFEKNYTTKIKDLEKQFAAVYNALKKRENDLKKWRKQEYDEGIEHITSNTKIIDQRLHQLNTKNEENMLYNIPKLTNFNLHRFNQQSLQIQNVINIVFQMGLTYSQNTKNTSFISFKMNKNPANDNNNIKYRMDKGKTTKNNNKIQQNGTKIMNYNINNTSNKESAIRGFDIGNNGKYSSAQKMAQNTNALPSNFWESESDTDSEQERKETKQQIVNRWKNQESNIQKNEKKEINRTSIYDNVSSSSDDNAQDIDDGFEKYVAQNIQTIEVPLYINTEWIIYQLNEQHKYDTMWFKLPKMRNGKANGKQMKGFMEQSGLSKETLKQIWRLSDLDKDGKMGNEEFTLCMFLIDKAKKGDVLPQTLPQNYIPPSFRGKRLPKTPTKKYVITPKSKEDND